MARPLRARYPGAHFHVTARGVARQDIFFADEDRQEFLDYLAEAHERWGLVFHAYCLMSNHYHLEVETPEGEVSRPLQWINHRYASFVNRKYDRVGHLFQGRFKSAVIEAKEHLHELTRYLHLNPVRAGLARHPGDYPWSSYRTFLGLRRKPPWLEIDKTLRRFGKSREAQRRAYRQFVERPKEVVQDPLRELQYGAILGTGKFVEWVRGTFTGVRDDPEVSQLSKARLRPGLEAICAVVCESLEVSKERLLAKRRHHNDARDLALYLACRQSGRRLTEIADYFGGMSAAAVSIASQRAETRLSGNKTWRKRAEEIASVLEDRLVNT